MAINSIEGFKKGIGSQEGTYNSENYSGFSSGTHGKYQFAWGQWGNKIAEFTNNTITTPEQFRNNPKVQEEFMDYATTKWTIPSAKRLIQKYEFKETPLSYVTGLVHYLGEPNADMYLGLVKKFNGDSKKAWENMPEKITKVNKFPDKYILDAFN
jgi:hypothetical protein